MKNVIKGIVCVMMVVLMAWGVWSWHDVVISNTPTNDRTISKYNFFYLLTKEEQPTEEHREAVATVYCTTDTAVVFNTMNDGMLWELRVADTNGWSVEEHYIITFNTNNSKSVEDDRIISVRQLQLLKEYDRGQ